MGRWLIAAVALLAACEDAEIRPDAAVVPGEDATTPPTPPSPDASMDGAAPSDAAMPLGDVPARDLCEEMATVWCEARPTCCSTAGPIDMAECVDQTAQGCSDAVGRVLIDPAVAYSPALGRGAVEEVRALAMDCDTDIADFVGTREGVLRVLEGTTTVGRQCAMRYDDLAGALSCRTGTVCHVDNLLGPVTSCGPIRGIGEQCNFDLECETGLYCRGGGITRGMCATVLADGSTCERWQECESFVCTARVCVERTQDGIYCAELFADYL